MQSQLESLVEQNYFLHKSAREAYRSFVQGYAQHPLKDAFNAQELDLLAVAKTFGFTAPPTVSLQVSLKQKANAEGRQAAYSRNGFTEEDPYGRGNHNAKDGEDDGAAAAAGGYRGGNGGFKGGKHGHGGGKHGHGGGYGGGNKHGSGGGYKARQWSR